MNTPTEHESRRDQRRRATEQQVAKVAERRFSDTRFDGLRPLPRRRATIVGWALSVVVVGAMTWVDDPYLLLAAFALGTATTWVLRAVVRTVPDLPDEHLDERLVRSRDRAYRPAYQAVVGLTLCGTSLMYFLLDASRIDYAVQPAHLNTLLMLVLFTSFGLPSAIYGWEAQEV